MAELNMRRVKCRVAKRSLKHWIKALKREAADLAKLEAQARSNPGPQQEGRAQRSRDRIKTFHNLIAETEARIAALEADL